ncbi:MAG: D-cysteine desulfhydrase family protein [Hyphomicrobiales bacterium]
MVNEVEFPESLGRLGALPRATLFSGSTQLEEMPNLTAHMSKARLLVKRDDCTELAFGGNKVRQLEFYFGQAKAQGADTILITGAVQSNFARLTAAAARKLGMGCHVQLEERVAKNDPLYRTSGNVLLEKMMGVTIHSYSEGEDEVGADRQLHMIADELKKQGHTPYIIPLAPGHAPYGALGYVVMAHELSGQLEDEGIVANEIVVASGSGATHAGLLFGLRAIGNNTPVRGVCVRRDAAAQGPRITKRCEEIAELLGIPSRVTAADVIVDESVLAPGYGRAGPAVQNAILEGARHESLMLDPTYAGKSFAGFLQRAEKADENETLIFVHTGGTPGIFAYQKDIEAAVAAVEDQ